MKKLFLSTVLLGTSLPLIGMPSSSVWGGDLDTFIREYEKISTAIDREDVTLDSQAAKLELDRFVEALDAIQLRLRRVKTVIQGSGNLSSWRGENHAKFFEIACKLPHRLDAPALTDRDKDDDSQDAAEALLSKLEGRIDDLKIDLELLHDALDGWSLLTHEVGATAHEATLPQHPVATAPSPLTNSKRGWFYTFNRNVVSSVSAAASLAGRLFMVAMAHGKSFIDEAPRVPVVHDVRAQKTIIDASEYLASLSDAL